MNELPILFSAPMVSAIMDGRKTQTRRVVDRVKQIGKVSEFQPSDTPGYDWTMRDNGMRWNDLSHAELVQRCPYGIVGDHLWVRETWAYHPDLPRSACRAIYRADIGCEYDTDKWSPSIHMPRWASRINLKITAVRVERLKSISDDDAIAEGIDRCLHCDHGWHHYSGMSDCVTPVYSYRSLWELLNGPQSWTENPWVWVIEFARA